MTAITLSFSSMASFTCRPCPCPPPQLVVAGFRGGSSFSLLIMPLTPHSLTHSHTHSHATHHRECEMGQLDSVLVQGNLPEVRPNLRANLEMGIVPSEAVLKADYPILSHRFLIATPDVNNGQVKELSPSGNPLKPDKTPEDLHAVHGFLIQDKAEKSVAHFGLRNGSPLLAGRGGESDLPRGVGVVFCARFVSCCARVRQERAGAAPGREWRLVHRGEEIAQAPFLAHAPQPPRNDPPRAAAAARLHNTLRERVVCFLLSGLRAVRGDAPQHLEHSLAIYSGPSEVVPMRGIEEDEFLGHFPGGDLHRQRARLLRDVPWEAATRRGGGRRTEALCLPLRRRTRAAPRVRPRRRQSLASLYSILPSQSGSAQCPEALSSEPSSQRNVSANPPMFLRAAEPAEPNRASLCTCGGPPLSAPCSGAALFPSARSGGAKVKPAFATGRARWQVVGDWRGDFRGCTSVIPVSVGLYC